MALSPLKFWTTTYDDLEKLRFATENRMRSMILDHNELTYYDPTRQVIRDLQNTSKKEVEKLFKQGYPELYAWAREIPGLSNCWGLARLVGTIGDPFIATPSHFEKQDGKRVQVFDPPYLRTVKQLKSYCGVGDSKRRRTRRGITEAEFKTCGRKDAQSILFNIVKGCISQTGKKYENRKQSLISPYRISYEQWRYFYLDTIHKEDPDECTLCKGQALWSDKHQDLASRRNVAQEIIQRIWEISRDKFDKEMGPYQSSELRMYRSQVLERTSSGSGTSETSFSLNS